VGSLTGAVSSKRVKFQTLETGVWKQFAPRHGNMAMKIWLYAGKPENPTVRTTIRDNPFGADNQQERPKRMSHRYKTDEHR
jgi:hypothetical protein